MPRLTKRGAKREILLSVEHLNQSKTIKSFVQIQGYRHDFRGIGMLKRLR
jgi:hypothetical protein